MLILDFDDFSEKNRGIFYLEILKKINPKFKVTLFTVPDKTSDKFIRLVEQYYDYIELVPHGYFHSYKECAGWDYELANKRLDEIEDRFSIKGFKAPFWETSKGLYAALSERGYWIADHDRNDRTRPNKIPCYKLGERSWHGHIQNVCGNGLKERFGELTELVKKEKDFLFVSEYIGKLDPKGT